LATRFNYLPLGYGTDELILPSRVRLGDVNPDPFDLLLLNFGSQLNLASIRD